MQFSTATILSILAVATVVIAVPNPDGTLVKRTNCDEDYDYCGRSLLKKGNYMEQIEEALSAAGQPESYKYDALFDCIGGPNGDIVFVSWCGTNKCHDAGANRDDKCIR